MPAARATPRKTSTATSRPGTSRCCRRWPTSSASSSKPTPAAAHEPLYQVQAVDKPPANPIIGGAGALPMRVLANRELQNAAKLGPQHAAYRGVAARRRQLPRRRSSQHRAAERRGAGRAGDPALRLRARRACHAGGGRRPARRAAGRRGDRRPSPAVGLRRAAASGDAQADPDHGAAHALSRSRGPSSRRCSTRSASGRRSWPSASRCSTSWRSIRRASCRSRRSSKCCR